MERKYPSRESPRRHFAKLGGIMEMKRLGHHFSMMTADSDKDSGFSDGSSDCLNSAELTNSENVLRTLHSDMDWRPWQSSVTTNNSFPEFSPMVVMKNMLVQQPFPAPSNISQGGSSSQFQTWTVQPSFEVVPAQTPQLLLLHPSIPPTATPQLSGGKKDDSTNCLAILNSYTKIAPQPRKRNLEDREEASRQKRLCTEEVNTSLNKISSLLSGFYNLESHGLRPSHNSAQQNLPALVQTDNIGAVNGCQHVPTNNSSVLDFPPHSSTGLLHTPSWTSHDSENQVQDLSQSAACSLLDTEDDHCSTSDLPLEQQSKNKRFQNTLFVLHKSGLLEITLKTKELINQNQVTQFELDQLKQQMQLFMEALKDNASRAWAELGLSLMQSDKGKNNVQPSLIQISSANAT